MADINNCTFAGRLTRDAELKTTTTGKQVLNFDLANNTGWGNNTNTLYIGVEVWGKQAETLHQYLTKGKAVGVCGSLRMDEWTKADGSKGQKLKMTANVVNFISGPTHKEAEPSYEVIRDEEIQF